METSCRGRRGRTKTVRTKVKGPRRYERQGPFEWFGLRPRPKGRCLRPPRLTGTGDAPDRCTPRLRSQPPHHPASAAFPGEPVPARWTLVSEPSRSPLRECVGEFYV